MANVTRINPITGKREAVKLANRLTGQRGLRRAIGGSVEYGKQAPKTEKRLSVGGKQKEKRKEVIKCALHSPRLQVEFEKESDVKPYARGFTTIDRK